MSQMSKSFQMHQPGIGDIGDVEIQPLQICQSFQMTHSIVCDLGGGEVQILQLKQLG